MFTRMVYPTIHSFLHSFFTFDTSIYHISSYIIHFHTMQASLRYMNINMVNFLFFYVSWSTYCFFITYCSISYWYSKSTLLLPSSSLLVIRQLLHEAIQLQDFLLVVSFRVNLPSHFNEILNIFFVWNKLFQVSCEEYTPKL